MWTTRLGGGSEKVVANNNGWVIVLNKELYGSGDLNSVSLNYNNGEPNDWFTLMDTYTMDMLGYGSMLPIDVAMSDYYAYASFGHYLLMKDRNNTYSITDILSKLNYPDSSQIACIAPTNSSTGYPVYLAIDTSYTTSETSGIVAHVIYKYDGTNYTKVNIPTLNCINRLYTLPKGIKGDTLFMETRMAGNNAAAILKTNDGGKNWNTIQMGYRLEVDYSAYWETVFPQSKGVILTSAGAALSTDLGQSFTAITNSSSLAGYTMAEQPNSTNIISCMNYAQVLFSTNWTSGTFSANANDGFTNVTVNKIAQSQNKGAFYLATSSGLAYTTAYNDTTIVGYDKWHTSYGQFPVTNCTGSYSVIAMDQNDSLHVIAGETNWGQAIGFSLTTSGPNGFSTITPSFTSADGRFGDVEFVTSNIVLCVTGAYLKATSGTGNIWRSTDGGNKWATVSPSGFSSGNCIAIAYGTNDTVIYVGTGAGDYDQGKIWKSTDLGASWTQVNLGPHDITDSAITSLPIIDMVVDPRGIDTLYIASGQSAEYGTPVIGIVPQAFVKSYDGGLSYQYINIIGDRAFLATEIDPNNPDSAVYFTNYREIFRYCPELDTTILIHKGMPAEVYSDIAIGSILVGTTTGFYSLPLEEIPSDTLIDTLVVVGIKNGSTNFESNIYPNPTVDETTLKLSLKSYSNITIEVKDIMDRKLMEIANGNYDAGQHLFHLSTKNMQSGTYIVKLKINNENNCTLLSVIK